MLSINELSLLYKIISDKSQTFENVSTVFNSNFEKDSKIKAASTLLILLEDNLLSIHQRIISYFILYDIVKKDETELNPFLPFILEKLKNSNDNFEQNFLVDFLLKHINYLKLTIDNYLKQNLKRQRINTTQIQIQWEKYYKENLKEKNININVDDKKRPVVYERKNLDFENKSCNIGKIENISNNNELNLNAFNANFMSFRPANNEFFEGEPKWIHPSLKHNFIWEKNNNLKK